MWRLAVFFGLVVVSCAPPEPPVVPPAPAPVPLSDASPSPRQVAAPVSPTNGDALTEPSASRRAAGIQAMDAERYEEAAKLFRQVLAAYPGNHVALVLLAHAEDEMALGREKAGRRLTNEEPTRIAVPPFAYTLAQPVGQPSGPAPQLTIRKQARNQVTDVQRWFKDNKVEIPAWRNPGVQDPEIPPNLPEKFGNFRLIQAIVHPDHTIAIFGANFSAGQLLAAFDPGGKLICLFDFATFMEAPNNVPADRQFTHQGIQWAEIKAGVLFVSHAHNTYAASSGGQNAYVSALDVKTGQLRWRSAPLVSNTQNFVFIGRHIVTGYGFTAEPDHLFVLDASTGKTAGKIPVASGPEYLFARGDELFVRTYDTDYILRIDRP